MDIALLVLRIVLGVIFFAHGAQKVLGWFGGRGLKGFEATIVNMGWKPVAFWTCVGAFAEFGSAILLLLGLLTFVGAFCLTVMMVVASQRNLKNGFFWQKQGVEYTFTLLGVAVALFFAGPGAYSLDAALGLKLF